MVYAAELTWNGQMGVEGEYQRAINRITRSTLGTFRSTPTGILAGGAAIHRQGPCWIIGSRGGHRGCWQDRRMEEDRRKSWSGTTATWSEG